MAARRSRSSVHVICYQHQIECHDQKCRETRKRSVQARFPQFRDVQWVSPGRHLGVVHPERPNSKGGQQSVAKWYQGVYMVQQVAAVRLDWGQAPSLDTENDI